MGLGQWGPPNWQARGFWTSQRILQMCCSCGTCWEAPFPTTECCDDPFITTSSPQERQEPGQGTAQILPEKAHCQSVLSISTVNQFAFLLLMSKDRTGYLWLERKRCIFFIGLKVLLTKKKKNMHSEKKPWSRSQEAKVLVQVCTWLTNGLWQVPSCLWPVLPSAVES